MKLSVVSLLLSLSCVLFALAAPAVQTKEVAVDKRQLGGITDILGLLSGATSALAPLLGLLGGLAGGGTTAPPSTGGGTTPSPADILSEITSIIAGLTSSLGGILPIGNAPTSSQDDVAQAVGDIVNSVGKAVSTLPVSLINLLAVVNLDINVTLLLTQLNVVISGILSLVTPIVSLLTTLPSGGLGLDSVLGLLGLL
ncbi:hypothetical protein AURDEDRAFT_138649 [Auricularia subglabra TFB-10046 SS5]|uniref:Uncharacterized protein n=1 Tax=Auricularia subglabra (strain TFB-10046 / SS5) TaxID=717982 RepID=J0D2Q6_AURST|nr:hypothetical protein AURDEDRAFT_138649 [Auricularia subglabra TFB-10046 SS5]